MANMNGQPPSKGNLKKHVDKLLDKHIKMMDQMTMEDVGF